MKKKLLFLIAMIAMLMCIFAISVNAEEMTMYIEFDVLLNGETDYQTVYTPQYSGKSTDTWTTYLSFGEEFYVDTQQSATIDKTQIIKVDMTNAKGTGFNNNNMKQLVAASDNSVFSNVTEIKFPNNPGNFNMIAGSFCKDWTSLTTIDFGSANQTGDYSFNGCTAITELTIPAQITKVNNYSFMGCTNLKTVNFLGNNINGTDIFSGCTSLTDVVFGNNITCIKSSMFKGCSSLTEITIPEGVTEIGGSAFMGTKLVSLHIPSTVTTIGMQVLEDVTTFTTLTFAENSQLDSIDHRAFQRTGLSGALVLPDGITDIDYSAFAATNITSATIPASVTDTTDYYSVFSGCTMLEYVEILSTVNLGSSFFAGCTALKAISLPEGMTALNERAFQNCSSLKAVYLPSTLEKIGSNTGWDAGAFNSCTSLYFVDKAFDVTSDDFTMPEKPEVYYMPSSLTTVYGVEFRDCRQINRYVVFPESLTSISAWEGAFSNSGSNAEKTYVFLGDMETFCYSARDGRYKNISYIFANENDVDVTSLTKFQLGYKAVAVNSYAYFCNGNVVYDLSSFQAGSETYVVQPDDFTKTTYSPEEQPHFVSPRDTVVTEVSCTEDATTTYYCFCGELINTIIDEEATGHNENSPVVDIYYPTFIVMGYAVCECTDCSETFTATEATYAPIFVSKGYSCTVYDGMISIVQGFDVNREALAEYTAIDGNTISYGVVATSINKVADGNIDVVNKVDGVTAIDFTTADKAEFTRFEIKVADIAEANWDTGLYACAYVIADGAVSFISENASTTTATAKTAATILQENPV